MWVPACVCVSVHACALCAKHTVCVCEYMHGLFAAVLSENTFNGVCVCAPLFCLIRCSFLLTGCQPWHQTRRCVDLLVSLSAHLCCSVSEALLKVFWSRVSPLKTGKVTLETNWIRGGSSGGVHFLCLWCKSRFFLIGCVVLMRDSRRSGVHTHINDSWMWMDIAASCLFHFMVNLLY